MFIGFTVVFFLGAMFRSFVWACVVASCALAQFECTAGDWFLLGSECVARPVSAVVPSRWQCVSRHMLVANENMVRALLPLLTPNVTAARPMVIRTNAILVRGAWLWLWPNGTVSPVQPFEAAGDDGTGLPIVGIAWEIPSGRFFAFRDERVLTHVLCHNAASVPCPVGYTYSRSAGGSAFRCVKAYTNVSVATPEAASQFCMQLTNFAPTYESDQVWDPRPGVYAASKGRTLLPDNVLGNGLLGGQYLGRLYWVNGQCVSPDSVSRTQYMPIATCQTSGAHPVCEYASVFRALAGAAGVLQLQQGSYAVCADAYVNMTGPQRRAGVALVAVLCRETGFRYTYADPSYTVVRHNGQGVHVDIAAQCSGFERYLYMCRNVSIVRRITRCGTSLGILCSRLP